jgi:transcriptional regulatory protein LevR
MFYVRYKKTTNFIPILACIKLSNHILSCVDSIRDLGVTVDSRLKFDKHISQIVHMALMLSRLILKCFHSRDRSLLVKACCTYVRPLLEYCCVVWSPHYHYLIDTI